MDAKQRGRRVGKARLGPDDVRGVRQAKAANVPYAAIAWWFGISEGQVWSIATRRTFQWVN